MATRARFLYGSGSVLLLASCAPGGRTGPSLVPNDPSRKLAARWMISAQSPADVQIAVSGYSETDVIENRVPMQFDVSRHPELPPRPQIPRSPATFLNRPCSTKVCPSVSWYRSQSGSGSITQDANGVYHLPDGSVWTSTEAIYAGYNNSGPLEGYIYHGDSGSQWWASGISAGNLESLDQFQLNKDAWYSANTDTSC